MRRSALMFAALFWFAAIPLHARDPQQLRLNWEEVDPHIAGKKVSLVLPDGTHIAGKALAVEPAGLRMKVKKSSNTSAQPKGEQLIPRNAISVLRIADYRKLGRLLVTTGALAVAGGIVAGSEINIYEGPALIAVPAAIAAGMVGTGFAGYYAGKAIDKRVTEIWIAPDAK